MKHDRITVAAALGTFLFLVGILAIAILTKRASADTTIVHGNNPSTWNGIPITEELRMAFSLYEAVTGSSVWEAATPIEQCTEAALLACGQGSICCVKIQSDNGVQSCTYCCHDGDGHCEHCQICYPNESVD